MSTLPPTHPPGQAEAGPLLGCLSDRRRAHSEAVALRVAHTGPDYVPAQVVPDLVLSAALHDIGYAPDWAHIGFHPIDGARHLRDQGFSALVCHLVAHHTAARAEAAERALDLDIFDPFGPPASPPPQVSARMLAVLTWADLNTGPDGRPVEVHDRLEEILRRYDKADPVHRYVTQHRDWLTAAGLHPLGMLTAGELP